MNQRPTSGGNNVYDITISATEANNTNTVTQIVAITVTDVGDVAPAFTSGSSVSFAENGHRCRLYRSGHARCDRCEPSATASAAVPIRPGSASTAAAGWCALSAAPTLKPQPARSAAMFIQLVVSATEANNTHTVTQSVAVTVTKCRAGRADIHQRQQRSVCRERHGCGLYRSGDSDRVGCVGVIQHQRRSRLGQVQHQQQRGGELEEQSRL